MVDLTHEQPAAHLEADVESRRVGLGHLDPAHGLIHAVVGDLGHRWVEEQGQVHAGEQQHDEAVQRDLAQQERPVGGEHLVQLASHRRRRVVAGIDRIALAGGDFGRCEIHCAAPVEATRGGSEYGRAGAPTVPPVRARRPNRHTSVIPFSRRASGKLLQFEPILHRFCIE